MLCKTLQIEPEQGELTGECCICKKETTNGFKKKFGGNFTSGNYISTGEVICPECNYLVKNSNEYRRTMFLLTKNELIKFKKKEAKDIVFNLPDEPFYIYLTKTWQKIGWIRMNEVYNNNNQNSVKFIVDYDIINTSIAKLKEECKFIQELRELKIPKPVLENGNIEMHHYRKLVEKYGRRKTREYVKHVQDNVKNPVWDLALYLED